MNKVVESYQEIIKKEKAAHQWFEENKDILSQWEGNMVLGSSPRIIIDSLEELHSAREFMRKMFPEWKDEIRNIFYSCGVGIATYETEGIDMEIWLEAPLDKFPISDLSPGCHWEPTKKNEQDFYLVCEA